MMPEGRRVQVDGNQNEDEWMDEGSFPRMTFSQCLLGQSEWRSAETLPQDMLIYGVGGHFTREISRGNIQMTGRYSSFMTSLCWLNENRKLSLSLVNRPLRWQTRRFWGKTSRNWIFRQDGLIFLVLRNHPSQARNIHIGSKSCISGSNCMQLNH